MTDRREESYGFRKLTPVDRLGVWLSQRAIRRCLRNRRNLKVLELGCGYRATQLCAMDDIVQRGVGVDFQIAPELRDKNRFSFIESKIEDALPRLTGEKFDLVMLISVLEHLSEPLSVLRAVRELLAEEGYLLINVPTWLGKRFLEFSAFRLHLSPMIEMDDHKMYYAKRDLWPLLVRAGFKPSRIKLHYHKFGLNLFAIVQQVA
jgi:SAM-dependent methyltransferase